MKAAGLGSWPDKPDFAGKELKPGIFGGTFNNVKITFDPGKRQAALDGRG